MLGLRPACSFQEVDIEYNKSLKLIHPEQCSLDGAAEVFLKLQPAYTEWNAARARQGWSRSATPSSALVNSASPGPAAAPASAAQPQSNGPAQGTSAASDNNIFSHCIIAEDNNSFHNWDAGLQFLSDKEISRKLFELRDFTFTSALPVGKDRTQFASCMKKVLVLADIFQDSIRARDTLFGRCPLFSSRMASKRFKLVVVVS